MALTVSVDEIVQGSRNPLLAARPHWKRIRLREIGSVLNGYAFKSSWFSKDRGMPLVRIRDVGSDSTETNYDGEYEERYVIEPGDLLIGMDGDFNCARWRGPRALLNQRVCKVTVESEQYNARFLEYVLPSYLRAINEVTSSITVKHLSSRSVEDIPLPVPPLDEQRRIVAELEKQFSRMDEAVANLNRVKTMLRTLRGSVLNAAVQQRLMGGYDSERWPEVRIGDVAKIVGGLTKHPRRREYPRQLPYLRVANVYANELRLDEIEYIGVADSELEKLLIQKGDMLVVEGNGSPSQIGRVALWDGSIHNCVHQNHLIKVRFGESVVPEWASYCLQSPPGRRQIELVSSSTSGLHTLSLSKIASLTIPLPTRQVQSKMVAEIERLLGFASRGLDEADLALHRSGALRRSTLVDAFGGAIPVA